MWDYENRLVKTIQPSGGVTSMAYDADGLRLKLEEPTGTKLFVWDDQNYLAETDAAGTTQAAFTTEPSTYGGLISHRKAGASTTYHFDALGSTRALTDASEAVLENYNYTAFGTLLGSPTLHTPFLWGGMVGYYWDAALATQYIRARHYQPAIARWISLDLIGFAGGDANLFRYVGNSPTSGATGMRVRLPASAYGQWQLSIVRNVVHKLFTANVYGSRGIHFHEISRLLYLRSVNLLEVHMQRNCTDPSGLEPMIPFGPLHMAYLIPPDPQQSKENCKAAKGVWMSNGAPITTNGCSNPFSDNPDDPTGGVSFKKACDDHDKCYSSCREVKIDCDLALFEDAMKLCKDAYEKGAIDKRKYFDCLQFAALYGSAVDLVNTVSKSSPVITATTQALICSLDWWGDAQRASCQCVFPSFKKPRCNNPFLWWL